MRPSQRQADEMRPVSFIRHFTDYAEGSVLASFGNTKVLCNVSIAEGVPRFLRDSKQGWLTAEYGLLPRSTHTRVDREATRGKQNGRTVEIQRLIGRALRAMVDLKLLNNFTVTVDCDVIQADGGTRTTAISGAAVALSDAVNKLLQQGVIKKNPLKELIAAVSVGVYQNQAILDLDYQEDSNADTDMNVVINASGGFVELQGTAEGRVFEQQELDAMLSLAKKGVADIISAQQKSLGLFL